MSLLLLACLSLPSVPLSIDSTPLDAAIPVSVDPRTELVAVVFRLAGSYAYNRPQSESRYADEVATWFEVVRDHEAVQMAKTLGDEHSISFDAPMTLAVHLDSLETLELAVPLDPWPLRLDRRWSKETIEMFLPVLRDFAEVSRFAEFFEDHGDLYAEAATRLGEVLRKEELVTWSAEYFGGSREGASTRVFVGLLQGGHNFGCGVKREGGALDLCPVLGAWEWDDEGMPVFGALHVPTAAHEFAHSNVNPVIDANAEDLDEAGSALLATAPEIFGRQAYGSGRIVLYESLVRATVLRYLMEHQGRSEANRMAQYDVKSGFAWVPELTAFLATEYEPERETYPDLASFSPRLVEFFQEQATLQEKLARVASVPRVVSTTPKNGDDDVDPTLGSIEIEFDQAMRDNSWSVTIVDGRRFPNVVRRPSYDATGKVFTVAVKLEPETSYALGINGLRKTGFASKYGVPAAEAVISFRTGAGSKRSKD